MKNYSFDIENDSEVWEIIDKSYDTILIHLLNPHGRIEWANASIKIAPHFSLENVLVRSMQFDLLTNLNGLRDILNFNLGGLKIYQFDKKVSDTLLIEQLPEDNKEKILRENGLQHIIGIYDERVIVGSFDDAYIEKVKSIREKII